MNDPFEKLRPKPPDEAPAPKLGEWDAGDDIEKPKPRGWLLGTAFCRGFLSSLIAEGGSGKTTLRYAQYLALATGRPLTGEHVFQRCRVLVVSLEDNADEMRRRILAARLHHNVTAADVRG
jgi:RecA-family ATPase